MLISLGFLGHVGFEFFFFEWVVAARSLPSLSYWTLVISKDWINDSLSSHRLLAG